MKRIHLATTAALAVGLLMAAPASADDDPNAAIKAETERTKAETEKFKAQKELFDAKWGSLNLPQAEGKVTLADSAGKMEATILSATAMNKAAELIAADVARLGAGTPIYVLAGDESIDFSLPLALTLEAEALIRGSQDHVCVAPPVAAASLESVLPAIGALVSAFKADTEIRGLAIEADSGALAHAVASKLKDADVYAPSELVHVTQLSGALQATWANLGLARKALSDCRGFLAPKKGTKDEVAVVDALIARIDAFTARATASTGGASPLVRAAALQTLSAQNANLLRVTAESAGGTMIKRSNLWTAFGALGVKVTGGLLASYRYADPRTGKVLAEGFLVCRTRLAGLGDVQKTNPEATCEPAQP